MFVWDLEVKAVELLAMGGELGGIGSIVLGGEQTLLLEVLE